MDGSENVIPFPGSRPNAPEIVSFDRKELGLIISIYGQLVAAGEWRDYAIDAQPDVAVFSIFRRSSERPVYRIEKRPKLAAKQGQYAVFGAEGQVLKRGSDLKQALRIFNRLLLRIARD